MLGSGISALLWTNFPNMVFRVFTIVAQQFMLVKQDNVPRFFPRNRI